MNVTLSVDREEQNLGMVLKLHPDLKYHVAKISIVILSYHWTVVILKSFKDISSL